MKKLFCLMSIFLLGNTLYAQEVVSSAGETQSISGYEVSWTVGEPVINTISSGTNVLTQGFHQSKLIVTALSEILFPEIEVKVFPNPTQEYVTIQFNELNEKFGFSLFDLTGKKLISNEIISTTTQVDLTNYANGSYILKLDYKSQQKLQTFKIVKK